jgi:hypothetical protein
VAKKLVGGCLAYLVGWAVLTAICYRTLSGMQDQEARFILSPLAAGLLTLGLASFWGLLMGQAGKSKDMLRRASTGEPSRDGEPMIATGRVQPLGATLTAALSGTPCVGYWYRMYYTREDVGQEQDKVIVYWGYGAQPFALQSRAATVRVLAVPILETQKGEEYGPDAVARARAWVEATRFEPVAPDPMATLKAGFTMMREMLTDDDGVARRDWKREGDERDPADLVLEETVVPVDGEASVYGVWSDARRAIVADTSTGGVQIVFGSPEKLQGVQSFTAYLATAIVMTTLGAAILWFGSRP